MQIRVSFLIGWETIWFKYTIYLGIEGLQRRCFFGQDRAESLIATIFNDHLVYYILQFGAVSISESVQKVFVSSPGTTDYQDLCCLVQGTSPIFVFLFVLVLILTSMNIMYFIKYFAKHRVLRDNDVVVVVKMPFIFE